MSCLIQIFFTLCMRSNFQKSKYSRFAEIKKTENCYIIRKDIKKVMMRSSYEYLWRRFSDMIDWAVDFAPRGIKVTQRFSNREQVERQNFYVKTQFGKNHGKEGENSLFSRGYSKLDGAMLSLQSLVPVLFYLMKIQVYKYHTHCNWRCGYYKSP